MPSRPRRRRRRRSARLKVFISHASQDVTLASEIVKRLRLLGVPCWYSPHRLTGADQWLDKIGRALKRCTWFAVLLTPRSVRAKWVKHEVQFALQADRYENRVLPLLLQTCQIDQLAWPLLNFQYIDLRGDLNHGCRQAARKILRAPALPPRRGHR